MFNAFSISSLLLYSGDTLVKVVKLLFCLVIAEITLLFIVSLSLSTQLLCIYVHGIPNHILIFCARGVLHTSFLQGIGIKILE